MADYVTYELRTDAPQVRTSWEAQLNISEGRRSVVSAFDPFVTLAKWTTAAACHTARKCETLHVFMNAESVRAPNGAKERRIALPPRPSLTTMDGVSAPIT